MSPLGVYGSCWTKCEVITADIKAETNQNVPVYWRDKPAVNNTRIFQNETG